MRKLSKILSGVLVFVLIVTMGAIGMSAYAVSDDVIGEYKFNITSTYKNVDWDNWKAYKAETHVHTVRSDADTEIDDMIEYYYGFGFDAMALTDHGTVNYGWTSGQSRVAIFDYQFFVHGAMDEPSKERYQEIVTGTGAVEGGTTPRGYGMREIPLGIELNGMSTKKCHINGFYADYGHGDLGMTVTWPRDAVKGNYNAGGLTHINHVGEWSDAKDDIGVYDSEFISDFASIYQDYGIMRRNRDESNLRGCLGMELVNTADSRTRNDRYLYDEVMKILAPQGINMLVFCEDDAHELSDCDRNAQYFIMPSNDMETNNIKHSMMYGEFYACSKNSKNPYELGDGFSAQGAYPSVSYVGVDDAKNQIIIDSKNANKIRMVADGEIIETFDISTNGDHTVFDLNKYENKINSYVRVYLTGPGGILYLQTFLVEKELAPTSSVTFDKPSTDTEISVFDSNGSLVEPVNTNDQYVLDAGNYTYIASRPGYLTTEPVPFTVSQAEIDNAVQRRIGVSLEKDSNLVYTYFYVPETIYLSGTDAMTFSTYVDRGNSADSALNKSKSSTGNIYFSRDGASDVTISYETVEGVQLNNMRVEATHSASSVLATRITGGMMSSPLSSGGHSLIKWTATYKYNGKTMTSNAYTYIYGTPSGANSTVAAGGQARTKKNITSWAHTTMHITATVWAAGVNSVSGGGAAYKFTPYGGSALADVTDADGLVMSGVGMGTASDESSGGSKTVNPVGGTGTLTIDTSRYNNLNQIPEFQIGLDINNCTEGEDAASAYVNLGNITIFSTSQVIDGSFTARRLFNSNSVDWPINTSVASLTVNGYACCKKSSRTDAVNGAFTLAFKYVDKGALRDQLNNAINCAYQPDWFENPSDYTAYTNAVKDAASVLGNPASTENEITSVAQGVKNTVAALKNNLKSSTVTVVYVDSATGEAIKGLTYPVVMSDTVIASAEDIPGYEYAGQWNSKSGGRLLSAGTDTYASFIAIEDNYTVTFSYNPKEYNIQYLVSDTSFPVQSAKANYKGTYKIVSDIPVQEGYDFDGWLLEADGKVYKPGDTVKWDFDEDSTLTAKWTPMTFTATYNLNGGTGIDTTAENVSFMDSYTITETIPEKDGSVFAGWLAVTESGEELGKYTAGSSFSWNKAENVTLTAQWTVVSLEVSLNANGGTVSSDKISVEYGEKYGTLPTPSKTGYNFDGWYLDEQLTSPVTGNTVVTAVEDHTLYAKWSKGQYKVTYYLDGKFYTETTYDFEDTIVPAAAPTNVGYTFSGWSEIPSTMPAENISVYGTMNVNSYKIHFVVDNEVLKTFTVEFDKPIPSYTPQSKPGYTFTGWANLPATMPAHEVTVTGTYATVDYYLYYYVDGQLYASETHTYGEALTGLQMPAKTGYTFSGWSGLPSAMPAENVYATGTYTANKYKLTYYVDGVKYAEEEYGYKDAITPLAAPEREGSEFSGWSYIPATMPSRDYTVNGTFTANDYSYFFVVDGQVRSELTIKAKFGDSITAPDVSVPTNYSFSGWSPEVPSTMGSQSMYFYGTTSKTASTVSYSLNGGSGYIPTSASYSIGETITLPASGITRTGFVFEGWSENSSAQSGTYSYTVGSGDVTLYAVWKPVTARIEADEESTTFVDNIHHIICGVKERITSLEFEADYIDVIGTNAEVRYENGIGFGTGSKVTLYQNDSKVVTYELVVYGDVDGDGIADGQDVQLATMIKEGLITKAQAGEAVYEAADCDHDGKITDNDIQLIINSGIKTQVIDQTK